MWEFLFLIFLVIVIFFMLYNSPFSKAVPKTSAKLEKSNFTAPGLENYVLTEKKSFTIDRKEVELHLYSRNFDAHTRAFFKQNNLWMSIPSLNAQVGHESVPKIPEFSDFIQEENYFAYVIHNRVYCYLYHPKENYFQLFALNKKIPSFSEIRNLGIKDDHLIVNDIKYKMKDGVLSL